MKPRRIGRSADADMYLKRYPHLAKWIVRCVSCQERGRSADMPDEITGPGGVVTAAGGNLRHYFPRVMDLDDLGRCDQCRAHPE